MVKNIMWALVMGRAACVWKDVAAAMELCSYDKIIAVNHTGYDWFGRLDCWVSFHLQLFPTWASKRAQHGFAPASSYWTEGSQMKVARRKPYLQSSFPFPIQSVACNGGSSGMIAVYVAFAVGCTRIVLAGIPLQQEEGHYDEKGPWTAAGRYREEWKKRHDVLKDHVRSLSGWTRDFLGEPTKEWLEN